jgi:NADPH:quinone reductase-like Zn-dependent oxidoreductase
MSDSADFSLAMEMPRPGVAPVIVERPLPVPGPGEALVRVRASSLNYHDLVSLMGLIKGPWPRVPMTDGAGDVVAVGPGVRSLAVGDRVIGSFHPDWLDGVLTRANGRRTPGDTEDGWLRQHVVYPANALLAAPAHLSYGEAATLVCAGTTAWSALQNGAIMAGDVVVTQGTGGVSLFALQLAKASGATVIITSSSDTKLERARALGADHGINYVTTPGWGSVVRELTGGQGADVVVDLGGTGTLSESIRATRMDGTVAVVGVLGGHGNAEVSVSTVMTSQLHLRGVAVGSVAAHRDLARAYGALRLRPTISHTFDWNDLAEAQRVQHAGEHFGKIVITIP